MPRAGAAPGALFWRPRPPHAVTAGELATNASGRVVAFELDALLLAAPRDADAARRRPPAARDTLSSTCCVVAPLPLTACPRMKIATWNVNGIRARQGQLLEWLAAERPDVVCLQEIKASIDQLPFDLRELEDYWAGGMAARATRAWGCSSPRPEPAPPAFTHPPFDFESRVISAEVDFGAGPVLTSSFYVPNGGKDFHAKLRFLEAMDAWAGEAQASGRPLIFCGDLNVARTDLDIHPKERKPNQVGARADERAILERLLARGLVDVGRTLHPTTTPSSRGGRRGATSSSATSAGGSTT